MIGPYAGHVFAFRGRCGDLIKQRVDRDSDSLLCFHGVSPDTGEMAQLVDVMLQQRAEAVKVGRPDTLADRMHG